MKKPVLLAAFLLAARLAPAQWADTGPGGESLAAVSFASPQLGWVCGTNAVLQRTRDGGRTWEFIPNFYGFKPHNNMLAVATPLPDLMVLLWQLPSAAQPSVIYYTYPEPYPLLTKLDYRSDQAVNGQGDFNNLSLRTAALGLAVGNGGTLRLSRDQGRSWTDATTGTQNDLWAADSPDGAVAYLVGSGGTVRKGTGPAFTSWRALNSTTGNRLVAVWFVDAQQGYVVGERGTALRTVDGGTTWAPMPVGTQVDLNAVRFLNATTGFIVGDLGTLLLTTDGGKSWRSEPSNTFESLNGLSASPDGTTVWAAGGGGTVLKRGPVTALAGRPAAPAPAWQAYPNPFRAALTLDLPPGSAPVEVRLLDPTGRVAVQQTVSSSGRTAYPLALPERLPPGVYLLQVAVAGRAPETRRLVRLP